MSHERPSPWRPGALVEYQECHRAMLAAERSANALMTRYCYTDLTDAEEATIWQALGIFDRFAAALTLESVVLWNQGAA